MDKLAMIRCISTEFCRNMPIWLHIIWVDQARHLVQMEELRLIPHYSKMVFLMLILLGKKPSSVILVLMRNSYKVGLLLLQITSIISGLISYGNGMLQFQLLQG